MFKTVISPAARLMTVKNQWINHRKVSYFSSAIPYHLLSSSVSTHMAPISHFHPWLDSL